MYNYIGSQYSQYLILFYNTYFKDQWQIKTWIIVYQQIDTSIPRNVLGNHFT